MRRSLKVEKSENCARRRVTSKAMADGTRRRKCSSRKETDAVEAMATVGSYTVRSVGERGRARGLIDIDTTRVEKG